MNPITIQPAVSEFIEHIDEKYGRGEDGNSSVCATGDRFDTLCINDTGNVIKPEGHPCSMSDGSLEAWIKFMGAFHEYMKERIGPIYWRQEPELFELDGEYSFNARLFATKKLNAKD